jgi:class 3 adenylate cyclase/tetratricopeptide (TPR) repeat protein
MAVCANCGAELPEAARFCPACAAPVDRVPEPAEERKVATVLFADLVGSTALGAEQDPERTRVLLDRFYEAMAEEIELAGGTVEKFVGDAVMAAFGAPAALEDHAERALHAALGMQRRLSELFGGRLALRIGVNTGEVVVGRPREGSSFVTGDAVNVGARLEQAAGPGDILVGERTASAVRGAFELAEPVRVEAKGKPGGVVAQQLVRALSLMRPRGVGGLRTVFVGRDAELARLCEAYGRALAEGRPQLVAIVGDAGVGKTRLVRELWGWLAGQEPQPLQRTGRCLSYGHGIAYWPLAEVLREHFDLRDDEGPDVALERFGRFRYLGLTLGLDISDDLHPLAARERLHDSWAEFLQELAAERPTVVLVEDVHWAEDDLLDLLDSLVAQVEAPLLVLATARPELLERRAAWHRWALSLEALREATAGELLDGLVGAELPPQLRAAIVERAEGNPFFVEELLATFIDRGVLQRQNGGWTYAELPEGFEVPDTVQAVLAARIDLLPAAEKAALQAAAVIGRVFWTGPVYELVGGAPDFDLLTERDFVRRRAGSSLSGEREYAIKHALTREVAYASLPKARRAQLHAAFARWLERSGEGNDEHAGLLAHHYAEAVRPEDLDLAWAGREDEAAELREKALKWSKRAADLAIGRYEIDEGLTLLQRAVDLETERAEQGRLWYEIGRASALKYDGEGFVAAMEKALELGAPESEVYAELGFQTVQRAGMWKTRPEFGLVKGWIDKALDSSDPRTRAYAQAVVARALWEQTEEHTREAEQVAREANDVDLIAHALWTRGQVLFNAGEYAAASDQLDSRVALHPQIGDPDLRCNTYFVAVDVRLAATRFADARGAVELLEQEAQGLTAHHRLHAIGQRVDLETALGGWAAVRSVTSATEAAVEANLATPCPLNIASLFNCALAAALLGDESEARRLEGAAYATGMTGYGFATDAVRILLALAKRDLTEAREIVEQLDPELLESWSVRIRASLFDALAALGERQRIEADAPEWIERPGYARPFALRALGLVREDEALVEQAAEAFDAMGLSWHARRTREHRTIA